MAEVSSRPRVEATEEVEDQIIVSDDDSGVESGDEAQTPSDGYFQPRQHAQRREHVQTPFTLSNAQMDAKSREAAEEQRARLASSHAARGSHSVQPPSRPSSAGSNVSSILTLPSPRARSPVRWPASEQAPLLDHGPAPPSYSDATAGRDLNLGQGGSVSEPQDGRQHEQLPQQQPSTYGPVNYGSFGAPSGGTQPDHHYHDGHHHHPDHVRDHSHSHCHSDTHHHHSGHSHHGPSGHGRHSGSDGPFGPHGVFGSHGPLGEHGPIFGRFMPQSMQDDRDSSRGRGRGQHRMRSRWDRRHEWRSGFYRHDSHKKGGSRRFCCSLRMFCNLLLAIAIILLLVAIAQISYVSNRGGSKGSGDPNQTLPISDPDNGVPVETPPSDPYLRHPNTAHCKFVHYSGVYIEQFNLRDMHQPNFTLIELIERSKYINGGVTGTITIVPYDESERFDISIVTHMATTASWRVKDYHMVATDTLFEVREPVLLNTGASQQGMPCLDVAIKVYVRKGAIFDNIQISTLNLDIVGKGGLFQRDDVAIWESGVSITNSSLLSTVKGSVDMPYWRSRNTYVSTVSGSIKGDYALLDLLSIRSQSGSVNIGVDPQEADKQALKPASLKTKTVSGSVDVHLITRGEPPDRDYKTSVSTKSGSIKGTFLLGTEALFDTLSASIQLTIRPYERGQKHVKLSTTTHSGQTTIDMVEPYVSDSYIQSEAGSERLAAQASGIFDTGMLSHLDATHSTTSASIKLSYPDEWSGRITARSVSGSLKVRGEGVVVDVAEDLPGYKSVMAHKGYGTSSTTIKSVSGSVDFLAGFVD